jgi:hypothetical protein
MRSIIVQGAAQRDCRKTLCLKNSHKNLPQQAQKSPKRCSEHKKQGALQCFRPTFQRSVFEKGLFRQFQRFALPALGWTAERRPTGKMLRRRKRLGIAPESPASGARFVGRVLHEDKFSFSQPLIDYIR